MAITLAGYSFEGPYKNTSSLRNSAGVYAILDGSSTLYPTVLDVGESQSVRNRVENHEREDCWKRNNKYTIHYAARYITLASERKRVETAVRNRYNPPCGER